jgi:uncharacterized protein (TIGR03086 family)
MTVTDRPAVADRYRRLAAAFADRVAAVDPSRWDDPSPCEEWTALGVVHHVVDTQGMFLGLVGSELGDIPTVEEDPLGAWAAAHQVVQGALDDPERAAAEFDGFFGRTTFAEAVDRFVCFDLVVHGWDLARVTGLDERLDPDDVERVVRGVAAFGESLRTPGVCGPAVAVPEGADAQTRMLALVGRRA